MAKYNFDEIIERRNTDCLKWDAVEERWHKKNLLPMWVADMDFRTPPFLMDALNKRNEHEVLGYARRPEEWYKAIIYWFKKRYGWSIKAENIGFVPGIVVGLCHALRCFTKPGDKVLIMPPVYFPFRLQILAAGCKLVNCNLKLKDVASKNSEVKGNTANKVQQFELDFEDFRKKIKGCKAMILCNPHNPGGRAWTRRELEEIAKICLQNKVLVLSDEIHCDLTFPPFKHIPFATVNARQALNTITFHAPSKTFNCAGLGSSEWVATNKKLHDAFAKYLDDGEFDGGNVYSFIPDRYVYTPEGYDWLKQALAYMQGNINYVEKFLRDNFTFDAISKVKGVRQMSEHKTQLITMIKPQASFLIYLNFKNLGLTQKQLCNFIANDAHLALNDGAVFGPGGEGFMRLNIGCPRATVEQAMGQLKRAFDKKFCK
jgi:cystathionine beta-lyase